MTTVTRPCACCGQPATGTSLDEAPLCDRCGEALAYESARIRRELLEWLIGDLDPSDAGLINGRRIVDEIDRLVPEEGT